MKDTVTVSRVQIRLYEGKPLVDIHVDLEGEFKVLGRIKAVKETGSIRETPGIKYMDQDIVKSFWDEAVRVSQNNKDSVRW